MRHLLSIALSIATLLFMASPVCAGDGNVKLVKKADTVEVTIGGEPFTVYNFGKDLPKPFFSPVRGAGGSILTRPVKPNEKEHKHHKGIWVSVDKINGIEFWGEKGKIENISVSLVKPQGNVAEMRVVNHWLGKDGKPVVIESTLISIHANRLFSYDITFTAGDKQVTFGDTKEGLLGYRMAHSMRESEGGTVVNAEGLQGTKACWGKVSDWIDYYGEVDGKTYGVTLFDHPMNFRRSRYHVRNYGLFSINPFGESYYTRRKRPADELILLPGKSVRLRYGLYIHSGTTEQANVAGTYLQYLKSAN